MERGLRTSLKKSDLDFEREEERMRDGVVRRKVTSEDGSSFIFGGRW